MVGETAPKIRRDATVVPVLRQVTPTTAIALGELVRQGFAVTAIIIAFDEFVAPDWAKPPEWAALLLSHGVDFKVVTTEESISELCTEAIVR
jgi:hypothetical protein